MRLSSLADYAVVMLSAAARHVPGERLTANLLADETGVPLPTAQKLMGRLAHAGLLVSARGTGGGVQLARDPATISLANIVEAVEGPIALTACVDDHRHDCGLEDACRVKPHWDVVNSTIRSALDGVSLATLSGVHTGVPA